MTITVLVWSVLYFNKKYKTAKCSYFSEEHPVKYEETDLTNRSLSSDAFNDPSFLSDLSAFVTERLNNYTDAGAEANDSICNVYTEESHLYSTYTEINNTDYSNNQELIIKNTMKNNRDYENASSSAPKIRKTNEENVVLTEYNFQNQEPCLNMCKNSGITGTEYCINENLLNPCNLYQNNVNDKSLMKQLESGNTSIYTSIDSEFLYQPVQTMFNSSINTSAQKTFEPTSLSPDVSSIYCDYINTPIQGPNYTSYLSPRENSDYTDLITPKQEILDHPLLSQVEEPTSPLDSCYNTQETFDFESLSPSVTSIYTDFINSTSQETLAFESLLNFADLILPSAIDPKIHNSFNGTPAKRLLETILIDFINNILYYRYNIAVYFSFFFSRYSNALHKHNYKICSGFLALLTKASLEFAEANHEEILELLEQDVLYLNYEQCKLDEQRLIKECMNPVKTRNFRHLKHEISRIRICNKDIVKRRGLLLKHTVYTKYRKTLKNLVGFRYILEHVLDMILHTLKPLYNLSMLFDRPENILLHDFLTESTHIYIESCPYAQNVTQYHLFHWAFFWGFSLSNYGLMDYFYWKKLKKENAKKIPHLFFAQSAIIIHSFINYEKHSSLLYLNNELFLKLYIKNVLFVLTDIAAYHKLATLDEIIKNLFNGIDQIFMPKYLLGPRPDYLRLIRLSKENNEISISLTTITKTLTKQLLFIAQSAYNKTENEIKDEAKDEIC